MASEIPVEPTRSFDARHLTDEEVLRLTPGQIMYAELSEEQWKVRLAARAPLEANPERVPAPEDLEKIKSLFGWIDAMHDRVHSPWGVAWVEVEIMLSSLSQLMEWAASDPPIHKNYRYRIDAPLDPNAQAPDHLPEDWES
jgi:hypothetical protein